ncbi:roadblock/LC7 domain-containing protein [Streptomyces otsuchiensis]|uniref:roadblock/LC7 domain-containing protein n=1 Tax=Streptomyces otsuchiensis TaxID=2681388 RepID=UPI001D13096F|nr:roadblock/LC7 domain-containing protein [Streptomyces otsuchiensis]
MIQYSDAPTSDEHAEGLRGLRWLLTRLVDEVPGLRSVAVVSSDGLSLLSSEPGDAAAAPDGSADEEGSAGPAPGGQRGPRGAAADLATVVSGLAALTAGAAELMEAGVVKQTMVTMADGSMMVMAISDGSLLGVHTDSETDPGLVAYHMGLFVGRAGHLLTPELRARLREQGGHPAEGERVEPPEETPAVPAGGAG